MNLPEFTHFTLDQRSPAYWRVTFDHPPINTITATAIEELTRLVDAMEKDTDLQVVVFDSANPDFFLAHFDGEGDPARTAAMPPGPTGMHPWLDLTARLTRLPVVSIAAVRGRVRANGSEFVLACDLRFAAETAVLGQFEVGAGMVPGGGAIARLPRLVGRGRALEILLVADDLDAALAEKYGYVNRLIPGARFEAEIERIAWRVAGFDHQALAETKARVDAISLPDDAELPPALRDFFISATRPAVVGRAGRLTALGLGTDSDLERDLGRRITESSA